MTNPDGRQSVQVAIAIVFDRSNGQLLICRRKKEAVLGGLWEFPGGKCGEAESPAVCAIREVEEETGLCVRVLSALSLIEHSYAHARVCLHPFICEYVSGTLELREVAQAIWIEPEAVLEYRFPEANGPLLECVAHGLRSLLAASSKNEIASPRQQPDN